MSTNGGVIHHLRHHLSAKIRVPTVVDDRGSPRRIRIGSEITIHHAARGTIRKEAGVGIAQESMVAGSGNDGLWGWGRCTANRDRNDRDGRGIRFTREICPGGVSEDDGWVAAAIMREITTF